MFRGFVDASLTTVMKLLLSVTLTSLEVISCLGRVLSALITTVGPELQSTGGGITSSKFCSMVIKFAAACYTLYRVRDK